MSRRVDAVVIGGGAIGSSAAWWLARRGCDVVLAEQFGPGHTRGSSHGEVRIFRLAYPDLDDVRRAQTALALWRELEDDAGEVLLEQIGALDHGTSADVTAVEGALAAAGAVHEVLEPAAVAERWPGLRVEGPAVFHPDGGRAFADRTVAALQRRAAAHGAEVRHGCAARIVAVGTDRVAVELGGESIVASVVVVTAGAWVQQVLAGLEAPARPPLTVTQQTVIHFPAADPSMPWPSFIHHEAALRYGLPSLSEGIKVASHHAGPVTDPDDRDDRPDPLQVQQLTEYAERWLPGVVPSPQFAATCLYTSTPDETFVIGRRGPVVVGSACSGHGFKFTPLTGRRLADLADEALGRPHGEGG